MFFTGCYPGSSVATVPMHQLTESENQIPNACHQFMSQSSVPARKLLSRSGAPIWVHLSRGQMRPRHWPLWVPPPERTIASGQSRAVAPLEWHVIASLCFHTPDKMKFQTLRHQRGQHAGHLRKLYLRTDCAAYTNSFYFRLTSRSSPLSAARSH